MLSRVNRMTALCVWEPVRDGRINPTRRRCCGAANGWLTRVFHTMRRHALRWMCLDGRVAQSQHADQTPTRPTEAKRECRLPLNGVRSYCAEPLTISLSRLSAAMGS